MDNTSKNGYEPYGDAWKKSISKLPKSLIIDMFAKVGKEKDKFKEYYFSNKKPQ